MCEYYNKESYLNPFVLFVTALLSVHPGVYPVTLSAGFFRGLSSHWFQLQGNASITWERKALVDGITEVSAFQSFSCCLHWKVKG